MLEEEVRVLIFGCIPTSSLKLSGVLQYEI